MTTTPVSTRGNLHRMAEQFSRDLLAGDEAAAQEMLVAWSDAYWSARVGLDDLITEVAHRRAEGLDVSPSVLGRETRFRAVMDQAQVALRRFGTQAAGIIQANQTAAQEAALINAGHLVAQAVATGLPGITADLLTPNPANLQTAIGFLGDGTPLTRHLERTVAPDAARELRRVMARGLTQGWSTRRLSREFTKATSVSYSRATTILRTESLRVYRETSRATYEANKDLLAYWEWQCALDRRSCIACIVQNGTRHPVTETLDGHPRCRCAMVPVTRSWKDLGVPDMPDTTVHLEPGSAWLGRQTTATQRAIMGPAKYDAWTGGQITLDDMVARVRSDDWGTMRTERSLRAIREGRHANFGNLDEG